MSAHSRGSSEESSTSSSSSSSGTAYMLIFEHVLSYPGTYEIPLRSMYHINSQSRSQTSRPTTPTQTSPIQSQFPSTAKMATAQFQSSLVNQITSMPSQPCSLPPVFITTFVRRCFPPELVMVDFPQALTALDYLKDLETRRRREQAAAFGRLGIERDNLQTFLAEIQKKQAGVVMWVKEVEANEKKVEALYTQVYIALRRWILINEFSLSPFNKHNCIAMLNTLYPPLPTAATQPTSKLTPAVLTHQRAALFDWIKHVELHGPSSLDPLMQQGKSNPGDANGWPAVRETLDSYLRVANRIIDDCQEVQGLDDFDRQGKKVNKEEFGRRGSSKADSGVSFNQADSRTSNDSRQQRSSNGSRNVSGSYHYEQSPSLAGGPRTVNSAKSLTALEKIARELRKIKNIGGNSAAPLPPPDDSYRRRGQYDPHKRNDSDSSNNSGNSGQDKENARPRAASRAGKQSGKDQTKKHKASHTADDDDREVRRPSSRNAVLRSFSRARSRSRSHPTTAGGSNTPIMSSDAPPPMPSRPTTATGHRRDDAFRSPPLPSHEDFEHMPRSEFRDWDDDDHEENSGVGYKVRKSFNMNRGAAAAATPSPTSPTAASSGPGSKVIKKMRSLGEISSKNKETGLGLRSANSPSLQNHSPRLSSRPSVESLSISSPRLRSNTMGWGEASPLIDDEEAFDPEEMRRQREMWEKKQREREYRERERIMGKRVGDDFGRVGVAF